MEFNIQSIFLPSVGVDIVFDINSLVPYSRSSIIYDTDFNNNAITIAQPITPFSNNTSFKELYLSTILHKNNRQLRVGLKCKQFTVLSKYTLANNKKVSAVKLKYISPAKEINIRSAFRLPLSSKYIIKGKVFYQNLEYYTARDFAIRDISLTGIGLVIPTTKNNFTNPLIQIKANEKIRMGLVLIRRDQDEPIGTMPIIAQVSRVNHNYSDTHTLIGLKIIKLNSASENILNKFIHDAQIDELKRLSRRNL